MADRPTLRESNTHHIHRPRIMPVPPWMHKACQRDKQASWPYPRAHLLNPMRHCPRQPRHHLPCPMRHRSRQAKHHRPNLRLSRSHQFLCRSKLSFYCHTTLRSSTATPASTNQLPQPATRHSKQRYQHNRRMQCLCRVHHFPAADTLSLPSARTGQALRPQCL